MILQWRAQNDSLQSPVRLLDGFDGDRGCILGLHLSIALSVQIKVKGY